MQMHPSLTLLRGRKYAHPIGEIIGGLLLLGLVLSAKLPAQTGTDQALAQVLKQMETLGKTFQSFRAQFAQKKYTAILKEFDTPESGEFVYARARDGSALLRQEVIKPARRILTIRGGLATIYQPAMNQAQVISLGKNKDKAEYLALGLGQSPAKLRETFDVRYQGLESLGGMPCSVLVLKPRSSAAAAYFTSIVLWIKKAQCLVENGKQGLRRWKYDDCVFINLFLLIAPILQ